MNTKFKSGDKIILDLEHPEMKRNTYSVEEKKKIIIDYLKKNNNATYKDIKKETKLHPERVFKSLKYAFEEAVWKNLVFLHLVSLFLLADKSLWPQNICSYFLYIDILRLSLALFL